MFATIAQNTLKPVLVVNVFYLNLNKNLFFKFFLKNKQFMHQLLKLHVQMHAGVI